MIEEARLEIERRKNRPAHVKEPKVADDFAAQKLNLEDKCSDNRMKAKKRSAKENSIIYEAASIEEYSFASKNDDPEDQNSKRGSRDAHGQGQDQGQGQGQGY